MEIIEIVDCLLDGYVKYSSILVPFENNFLQKYYLLLPKEL